MLLADNFFSKKRVLPRAIPSTVRGLLFGIIGGNMRPSKTCGMLRVAGFGIYWPVLLSSLEQARHVIMIRVVYFIMLFNRN